MRAFGLINYAGGAIGRAAGTAIATGVFLVVVGIAPAEFVAAVVREPPAFMRSGLLQLVVVVIGLAVIGAALRFNLWSMQQEAIDDLAEDVSHAISFLLNRAPAPQTPDEVQLWESDYRAWCTKVSGKLENRAFFSRADQLHFDRLGFVKPVAMSGDQHFDWLLSQLSMKLDRLREVINWTQQRKR